MLCSFERPLPESKRAHMADIFDQFGGEVVIVLTGMLMVSLVLLGSLISNDRWRLVFSLFTATFTLFQLISLFATQEFVGYQFYVHLSLGGLMSFSDLFVLHLVTSLIGFVVVTILCYYSTAGLKQVSGRFGNKKFESYRRAGVMVLAGLLVLFVVRNSTFIVNTKSLFTVFQRSSEHFEKALAESDMHDYVFPDEVRSSPGENIIIISLESFERSFLTEKFSSLTPNLRRLRSEWNYFKVQQSIGSHWTSGSLYTCLTGFPAFFGVHGNNIFKSAGDSGMSGISHALKKSNYSVTYLNGDAGHAGMENMLETLKFDKIIDKKNAGVKEFESRYGIRDKDLFELAKDEVRKELDSGNPFAVFISTTDTHFPNGLYDERMEDVISPKDSDLEFMVAAVDYLVGDFIEYLDSLEALKNTTVYIFPDHLKMGDPTLFNGTGERGLYLISNSERLEDLKQTKDLLQIDLPGIILKGAKVDHNIKFLSDYISGDKVKYLKDHIFQITKINTSGILRTE